jgi:hypothetical protein
VVRRLPGARRAVRGAGAGPRVSRMTRAKAAELLDRLHAQHPDAHIELDWTTPLSCWWRRSCPRSAPTNA